MKKKILNILLNNKDYISREKISNLLNISRTSVWKHIKHLKNEGYIIDSISNKGYKLLISPHNLYKEEVLKYLKTSFIGSNYLHFSSIDSTNLYCKNNYNSLPSGTVIVSEEQTNGKGRLDRYWHSSANKGLYFSILIKPELELKNAPKLSLIISTAICKTLREHNINALIKWPNDIIVNSKKVGGILSELIGDMYSINSIIIGIGINVNNNKDDFPNEISEKASSLLLESNIKFNRAKLLGDILTTIEKYYFDFLSNNFTKIYNEYRSYSLLIGKEVYLIKSNSRIKVKIKDINVDGSIKVSYDNNTETDLMAGEFSIRGLENYI